MEINGVAHVFLTVSNYDACVAFYEPLLNFLGLRPVPQLRDVRLGEMPLVGNIEDLRDQEIQHDRCEGGFDDGLAVGGGMVQQLAHGNERHGGVRKLKNRGDRAGAARTGDRKPAILTARAPAPGPPCPRVRP